MSDLCRRCDVFVGYFALGVAVPPAEHADDEEWLRSHCWVCRRSRAEIAAAEMPEARKPPDGGVFDASAPPGRRWCTSADHHEWQHMLLDRAKADLKSAYGVIHQQGAAMRAAGVTLPDEAA